MLLQGIVGVAMVGVAFLTSSGTGTEGPVFAALVRITGVFIYATMWLSFLPPASYTRWLKRRHQEHDTNATPIGMEA